MAIPGTGLKINGNVYDYSSITATIDGLPYQGITEISYSDTLEPGILRGTSALIRGRSRGMYECEASMTVAKQYFEPIKQALVALAAGGGFMEAAFLITVTYADFGIDTVTDVIEGCRIKHNENSHSAGNADPLVHKFDLSPLRIKWNGAYGVGAAGGFGL